jgi:hypothetical protein
MAEIAVEKRSYARTFRFQIGIAYHNEALFFVTKARNIVYVPALRTRLRI